MSAKAFLIWLLVGSAIFNAVVRLWGNWALFLGVLAAQAFFIFGGIYPYLFNKTMIGFPGTTDLKPSLDDGKTGSSLERDILLLAHVAMYCLMFLAS